MNGSEAMEDSLALGAHGRVGDWIPFFRRPPRPGPALSGVRLRRRPRRDTGRREHAIKFTEACLREYALIAKPVYLLAARHAIRQLA